MSMPQLNENMSPFLYIHPLMVDIKYIAKLRKQLEIDPNVKINNIHGEGFRLVSD